MVMANVGSPGLPQSPFAIFHFPFAIPMKRIAILGSTGSIGRNTLALIEHLGPEYRAVALAARQRTDVLLEQVRRHRPAAVAIADGGDEACIREIESLATRVYRGADGLVDLVRRDDVDMVVAAVVGAAGLPAV